MIAPSLRTTISVSAARRIRLRVAAVAAGCDQTRSRSAPSAINCWRSGPPSGGGRRAIRAAISPSTFATACNASFHADRIRTGAEELIALSPNLIVVWANPAVAILRNATQSIPIVFVTVSDPVGSGFVTNLARPGGNITGFENFQTAIGGKWLEVLKDIAPEVRRIAFVHSPDIAAHVAFLRVAETASISRGMTVISAGVRNAAEIESAITAFAQDPNGGLIIAPSPFNTIHQDLIISLAARLRLPAIYPFRYFSTNGGLASYGFDTVEQHRGAASYVDRILKGEKPAKALGLTISREVQLSADEVIE
jgi:putative ABC transport system substrate-binding protein